MGDNGYPLEPSVDEMRTMVDRVAARVIDHIASLPNQPASYTEEQLHTIHASMGIRDHHFDLIVDLVSETLEDHDVDAQDIGRLAEKLNGYRSSIVGASDSVE